ncbi:TnpV protein [Ruminococcaceae bacterium OttesenSCG-928-D13]|nr:TnpV protein [Ruminococcaceae bacterium OttesenSCG-928-D13]
MKSLFEKNGGTYWEAGDYYLPNLVLPNEIEYHIGLWGQQRLNYLKKHRRVLYVNLLTFGQLDRHLREVDAAARERREILIQQMARDQGVTEQLKSKNQIHWVGRMNNIRACADEIIYNELIYDY